MICDLCVYLATHTQTLLLSLFPLFLFFFRPCLPAIDPGSGLCTNDIPGQQVRSRVRSVPALSSLRCFTCQHHRRRCVYAVRVLRALGGGELRTAWTWAGTPCRTPIYDPRGGPQPLSMGIIRVENVGSGSQVRCEHPNPLIYFNFARRTHAPVLDLKDGLGPGVDHADPADPEAVKITVIAHVCVDVVPCVGGPGCGVRMGGGGREGPSGRRCLVPGGEEESWLVGRPRFGRAWLGSLGRE